MIESKILSNKFNRGCERYIYTMNITEMKKIQINEKTSSTYELKDLVLLKWAILSKEIYRSNAIPITISSRFCGNGKADPQIHMEFRRALNGQNNLRKEHRWKTLISRFQNLTTSYCEQNSVVLA